MRSNRVVSLIAVNDPEEVVGSGLLMGEDVGVGAAIKASAVIKAPSNVSGSALLAALENKRPNPAFFIFLLLQPRMDKPLRRVKRKRLRLTPLSADTKALRREEWEIFAVQRQSLSQL